MKDKISFLKKRIIDIDKDSNILCLLLFGSFLEKDKNGYKDLDAILVVNKISPNLINTFNFLKKEFKLLDVDIYTEEEINKISFYTREYKLEYLVKGNPIIGKNLFIDINKKVSKYEYKKSIFIRSVEHLQMVRRNFLVESKTEKEAKIFLEKYFFRISRNILLYKGVFTYDEVYSFSKEEILHNLEKHCLIKQKIYFDIKKPSYDLFKLFDILSHILIKIKNEIK